LGDDHDLAVLRRTVLDDPGGFVEEKELLLFVALIDQKRLRLQAAAQPLGDRIYSDPSKTFTRRIKSYWKAWQAEGEGQQAELIDEIQKASPPSMHSVEGLLTTGEMAARLAVSAGRVRELIRAGKLPAEKVGTRWIIKVGESTSQETRTPNGEDKFPSPRRVADLLGISLEDVRKRIYAGELPATKEGRN
jgi:excisionase family DNA binding protein